MDRENLDEIVEQYYDEYDKTYQAILHGEHFKDVVSIDNGVF